MKKQDRGTCHRWMKPYLLKGLLRTGDDFAMSPGSVHRPGRGKAKKRLVRYYVSQRAIKHGYGDCGIKAINAAHLDDLVRALVLDYLASISFDRLALQSVEVRDHWIREILDSVVLSTEKLQVRLDSAKLSACRAAELVDAPATEAAQMSSCPYSPEVETRGPKIVLTLAIRIKRLDGRRMIVSPEGRDLVLPSEPEPKAHIVGAIGLAYAFHEELLRSQTTIARLARARGMSECWVRKLLDLTHLGPEILKCALTGSLPPSLTLDDLFAASAHLDWSIQARALGFTGKPSAASKS